MIHVLLGAVSIVVIYLYLFFSAYPTAVGKSLAGWTMAACNSANGFLHGRLVPLIFPWVMWWAWRQKRDEVINPSFGSFLSIGFALLIFWVSIRLVQPRFALAGMPFLVIGLVHSLFGWRLAKAALFPAFFLWFLVPIPGLLGWIDSFTNEALNSLTVQIGSMMGIDIVKRGSSLFLQNETIWIGTF